MQSGERLASKKDPAPTTGLDKLLDYHYTGDGLAVNTAVYENPSNFSPLVRGVKRPLFTSAAHLIDRNPVYFWMQMDRDSFEAVARRDKAVKSNLAGIDELVDSLQNPDDLTPQKEFLYSSALTERVAELAYLAYPYIPASIHKKIEAHLKRKKNPGRLVWIEEPVEEGGAYQRLQQTGRQRQGEGQDSQTKEPGKKQEPKFKGESSNDKQSGKKSSEPKQRGDDGLDEPKPKRQKVKSDPNYRHPTLDSKQTVGRERRAHESGRSEQAMIQVDPEMVRTSFHDVFVMTKIFNHYDPVNGTLEAKSELHSHYPFGSSFRANSLMTPIGAIDADSFDKIGIPIPVKDVNDKRYKEYSNFGSHFQISEVEVANESGVILIAERETRDYIRQDYLGNTYLSLKDMPSAIRDKIGDEKIVIQSRFSDSYHHRAPMSSYELIGSMPAEERYRLNLYPEPIAKLITTLLKKKEEGARGFQTNTEIFARIAQFLGNYWLKYDLLDAESSEDDPVGFQQTERVLTSGLASCEGSNITLGQLMRYFIEDDREGIAYVDGFVIDKNSPNGKKGTATPQSFHLKVLYQDRKGTQHFFDATPWSPEDHDKFETAGIRYVNAQGEWIDTMKDVKAVTSDIEQPLSRRAATAHYRLSQAWYLDSDPLALDIQLYDENLKAHMLPGFYTSNELSDVIDAQDMDLDQGKVGLLRKWLPFGKKATPFSPYEARNLIPFLKRKHQVDAELGRFWNNPQNPIDGYSHYTLSRLERDFYGELGSTYMDVNVYLDRPGKDRLLNDHRRRATVYDRMASVLEQGYIASDQNIFAFNTLAQNIEELSAEYEAKMREVFTPVGDKLGVDVEAFMKGAPFILLLRNPLYALRGFFTRIDEPEMAGFLAPVNEEEIKAKFEETIAPWKEMSDEVLDRFKTVIEYAPLTRQRKKDQMEVSSLMLWEATTANAKRDVEDEERVLLEPIPTFRHLLRHGSVF